ncbi:phosphotyrosine protein phosphatase [Chloropicon primus]|uniref:Phosphotyrosine protein phosphatase n=1 Tax=Chloropicon primus TaxID=1764295 RepID=A0A5B8N0B1_9CHLO|nr:phosphotyrosine protein phosphatase [Chloropicon primus]UPR04629.1 phosphotyrosine protein phosphatase [Chloropicon primus]|eukprot:QDZ25432.1 phosphotyrosine protein phosphatase [Chloropicon primus]
MVARASASGYWGLGLEAAKGRAQIPSLAWSPRSVKCHQRHGEGERCLGAGGGRAPSWRVLGSEGRGRRVSSARIVRASSREIEEEGKVGVIFVCLGNICRSPTAEAVFGECVKKAGLAERFLVESCGTGGGNPNWYQEGGWSYHEGESSDPRMKQAASERGITITSTSRPLNEGDFGRFEYIVGMDESNLTAIRTAANAWGIPREGEGSYKVLNMADYCREHNVSKVPDPYYAGGFDKVIDLLEDACEGLLDEIKGQHGL